VVELQAWCSETGLGVVVINGVSYALGRLTDEAGRTIGAQLARPTEDAEGNPTVKTVDVDFTPSWGWQCDCECATYNPERGPCKHCQALRIIGQQLGRALTLNQRLRED